MLCEKNAKAVTFMSKSYKTSICYIIFCNKEVSVNQYTLAVVDHS